MKLPRILICAPTSNLKDYCFDEWYANVQSLTYPNKDIFLADNSMDDKNYKRFLKMGIGSEWIKPKGRDLIERIALSHEACRQYAIRKGYRYILHLETDVFPDKDVIERLLFHRLPIVGGYYYIRTGKDRILMIQSMEDHESRLYRSSNFEDEPFCDGTVKPCFSIGLGCVLIRRDVFSQIPFRCVKGELAAPDTYFSYDLVAKRFQNHVDTSLFCTHKNQKWVEQDGKLIQVAEK